MRLGSRIGIIINLLKHLLLNGNKITNIRLYAKLLKVLYPLRKAGLIRRGTSFSFLSVFLSRSLTNDDKLRISIHHYQVIQQIFSGQNLKALFSGGIECYQEQIEEHLLRISLIHSGGYEFEGPFSLLYNVNGIAHFKLSFMIVPGSVFGLKNKRMFYISCMQKKHTAANEMSKTILIDNIHPAMMLLNVLRAFGDLNGINDCMAVSAKNQLSFIKDTKGYDHFFKLYDDFWLSKGAVLLNNDYLLTFPLMQKPILAVKQTHRNRVRKKRVRLQEVYNEVYNRLNMIAFFVSFTLPLAF